MRRIPLRGIVMCRASIMSNTQPSQPSLEHRPDNGDGDARAVVGWREYIALPEWGVEHIKTKIDTGARTSAIDVADLVLLSNERARFDIVVDRRHPEHRITIEQPIVRQAKVKSSLGALHTRPVVETRIRIGPIEKTIQLGLVCRKNMACRMLLGRAALTPELLVDSAHRYLFGRKRTRKR